MMPQALALITVVGPPDWATTALPRSCSAMVRFPSERLSEKGSDPFSANCTSPQFVKNRGLTPFRTASQQLIVSRRTAFRAAQTGQVNCFRDYTAGGERRKGVCGRATMLIP